MSAQEFLTQLLAHMGVDTAVVHAEESDDAHTLTIACDENESGLLIGRHAETLDALQYLVRIVFQKDDAKTIVVNINDFRQKREEYLLDLASRVAARVMETGKPQTLRLNAAERRVVHMALTDHPDVTTESEGEGIYRVLRVFLKEAQMVVQE